MKNVCFFLLVICLTISSCTQDVPLIEWHVNVLKQPDYDYSTGKKAFINYSKKTVILRTDSGKGLVDVEQLVERIGATLIAVRPDYKFYIIEINPSKTKIVPTDKPTGFRITYAIGRDYEPLGGHYMSSNDQVWVAPKDGYTIEQIVDSARVTDIITHIEKDQRDNYTITFDYYWHEDVNFLANRVYETGMCRAVSGREGWLTIRLLSNIHTNQWGLKNTGQSNGLVGCDIKIEQAWTITQGSPNVKVAVVDDGISLNHPNLIGNLLPGYSAILDGGDESPHTPAFVTHHATLCAGIIAASDANNGPVGVAPMCKIVPIRILSNVPGYEYYSWDPNVIERAIDYAWQTAQADVILCAWDLVDPSQRVTDAVNDATTQGRNGKGCVVVAAVGEGYGNYSYPATLEVGPPANLPNVLGVTAIDRFGKRLRGNAYGACCGPGLNVSAPGVDIYATNIQGYVTDYGTSLASAFVAGVAALVISVYPNYKEEEVRRTIESTAIKLNDYNFSNAIGGSWNKEVGYGLVNAFAAVQGMPSCTERLTNQVVSADETVNGYNICVDNVTVTSGAKLTIDAKTIDIEASFETQLGAELDLIAH